MTDEEREVVICSVINIFIPFDVAPKSLDDNLQDAVMREVAETAIRNVGGTSRTIAANYSAVMMIVASSKSQTIVDFAVSRCLEIYNEKKSELFGLNANDALSVVSEMLAYASNEMREKVIAALAEAGFYGRIEGLARRYLNRGLVAEQVMALVNKYVNEKGRRSDCQEAELVRMAREYSPGILIEVQNEIAKFVKEFEDSWD